MSILITSFYRFVPLTSERVGAIQSALEEFAEKNHLMGLCLLGSEGINATVSGSESAIAGLKTCVSELMGVSDIFFKDSIADKHPFLAFKIKIKHEIVTLGVEDRIPTSTVNGHISPEEWHMAVQDSNTVVIDTRNKYEVEIGKFKTAIDFGIDEFNEFPEAIKNSGIDKDKRVLIYCTGGIRCEKAALEMQAQGFTNVQQLDGGILNYIEKFPNQEFSGECFVFDYRVAVDQMLRPSQTYGLCPHCGQPSDQKIECTQCHEGAILCQHCLHEEHLTTCSKNCEHHKRIGSRSSRRQVLERMQKA